MVTMVTSFGRSGVYDWVIQRVSSVIMLAYFFLIMAVLLTNPDIGYADWKALFSQTWMRIFSLAALLSMAVHAWIGLWCVVTDYLTTRMLGRTGDLLRFLVLSLCATTTFVYVVWGVQILWGM